MLNVKNLTISFKDEINNGDVVSNISFQMDKGEILAIVGESGSGKSMTALGIIGLLKSHAQISGSIQLDDLEVLTLKEKERHALMGSKIAMIFQEPMTSLNPVMKVGKQVAEMIRLHPETLVDQKDVAGSERKKLIHQRVIEAFEQVGLPEPEKTIQKYPHELSGGMRQRVMIAMASICKPSILIADEPTTALDVQTQKQIIDLLKKVNKELGISILMISHDLNVVSELASRIIVMNQGKIVEEGTTDNILNHPQDSYTKKLINSVPRGKKVPGIIEKKIMVQAKDLSIYYKVKNQKKYVVTHMNFEIYKGEILGLVGRSGLGKTTISKAILGIHKYYDGEIINHSSFSQMIFQDPYSSLNPAKTIGWILEEPLKIRTQLSKTQRKDKVGEFLEKVGLTKEFSVRKPHELSGGQRQRVSIALALIGGADFIIADEPVSALDVTIQAQILELLLKLQKEFQLTILFISHDIHVIEKMCDRIIEI